MVTMRCIDVFENTRCRTNIMRLHTTYKRIKRRSHKHQFSHAVVDLQLATRHSNIDNGRKDRAGSAGSEVACANRRTPLATLAVTALNSRQVLACGTRTLHRSSHKCSPFGTSQDVIAHDNHSSLYPIYICILYTVYISQYYPIMPDCTAHLSESLPWEDC